MSKEILKPEEMTQDELLAAFKGIAAKLDAEIKAHGETEKNLKIASEAADELNEALSKVESGKKDAPKGVEITLDKKKYLVKPGVIHVGKRKFLSAKELSEDKKACEALIAKGSGKIILINK